MIKQAISMEDPEKQEAFTEVIGNYMKLVYQNWNRENVTDDLIKSDLEFLSGGKLTLHEESNLDTLSKANHQTGAESATDRGDVRGGRYQRNFKQNKNCNFKRNR